MSFLSQYASLIEAVAAGLSAIVALLLLIVASRQAQIAQTQARAQRLEAFRDIVRYHHDHDMRALRRLVRVDLVEWFKEGKLPDKSDEQWIKLQNAYEDVMNYYEYLGSLMKGNLIDEEIVLRMVHGSATAIWEEVHVPYGDKIRPPETRPKDYAGEFEYLVSKAKQYRISRRL